MGATRNENEEEPGMEIKSTGIAVRNVKYVKWTLYNGPFMAKNEMDP